MFIELHYTSQHVSTYYVIIRAMYHETKQIKARISKCSGTVRYIFHYLCQLASPLQWRPLGITGSRAALPAIQIFHQTRSTCFSSIHCS
jgi:hypothetical protein